MSQFTEDHHAGGFGDLHVDAKGRMEGEGGLRQTRGSRWQGASALQVQVQQVLEKHPFVQCHFVIMLVRCLKNVTLIYIN